MNEVDGLPLWPGSRSCVRSGYCCSLAPCPFGEAGEGGGCIHLEGDGPGDYSCGIADKIITQPGWELAPAFGAGCCSPTNSTRQELIKSFNENKDEKE